VVVADTELELLRKLSSKIHDMMGLSYPDARLADLRRRLQVVATNLNIRDVQVCVSWLINNSWGQKELDALAQGLTIGETYFFRDKKLWDMLEADFLPKLIKQASRENRQMNFWSAACCTGEEPYSLAILLQRLAPQISPERVRILGTDLNTKFLGLATDGLYSDWSFRTTPKSLRETYFNLEDGKYRLNSQIRNMVEFRPFNLNSAAEHPYPEKNQRFDLIICRNVFVYFSGDGTTAGIRKLGRLLAENGRLVISPHDLWACPPDELQVEPVEGVHTVKARSPGTFTGQPELSLEKRLQALSKAETWFPERKAMPAISPPKPEPVLEQRDRSITKQPSAPVPPPSPEPALGQRTHWYVEKAARLQKEMLSKTPSTDDLKSLVEALCNAGEVDNALEWLDKAIALHPLCESFYYTKGNVLHEVGQHDQAIRSLHQAIFLNPDFVMAQFSLYHVQTVLGNSQQASIHMRNLIRLLQKHKKDDCVPEGDDMTAGQLLEIVTRGRLGPNE
jgi:chemotaxis protein methyltransferase CheR